MLLSLEMSPEFLFAIREAVREELVASISQISVESDNKSLTIKEVAEFMQVSVSTVRQYIALGLPHFQSGQVIRFIKSDVIAWMRNNPL